MFEKEAKERAKDYTENKERQIAYECGFLDGVDFAYNKANEWHYVKDGDFPEEEDDVYLVYTTKGVLLGHYEQGGADGETSFTGEPYSDFTEYPSEMLFTEDEVIAWKEIIPPELKESE